MSVARKKKEFWNAYKDYYPLIYSALVARIGNKDDAEDICQEVFIRFYHKMDEVIEPRKWLYKAMTFEISNYYNKKSNTKHAELDITIAADDGRLSMEDEGRETKMIIQEAIENMQNFKNEQEKVIFDLIAIHNYTYSKTAEYMGLTKWQVQYVYTKIEKRILKYLKKKGIKEISDILCVWMINICH